jgi:hypothetical protein
MPKGEIQQGKKKRRKKEEGRKGRTRDNKRD